MWVFIMSGRVFEQNHGERNLLKETGRVIRWPSHMQPWMTPWTRRGSRNEFSHTGGSDRRLQEEEFEGSKVTAMAQRLVASLGPLAEALDTQPAQPKMPVPLRAEVAWPAGFQPSLLASKGEGLLAALSREHRGAILHVPQQASAAPSIQSQFTLAGIDQLGELLGASWGASGLIVVTASGAVAECTGLPDGKVWPCLQFGARLPSGGSAIKSAVVARVHGTGLLRVAVTFEDQKGVTLLETDAEGKSWTPTGEIQLPHEADNHHFSLSPAGDELIISSNDGGAVKWRMGESEPSIVTSQDSFGRVWHSTCGLGGGKLAHLASRGVVPELLLSSHA